MSLSLTIQQVRELPEPKRDYTFSAIFPVISGMAAPQVERVVSPFYSLNADTYLINYRQHSTAGMFDLGLRGELSAYFYEDIRNTASAWYNAWLKLIRNPDGTFNYKITYAFTTTIITLDPMLIPIQTKNIYAVYPKSAVPFTFLSASNGRIVMQADFYFDETDDAGTVS